MLFWAFLLQYHVYKFLIFRDKVYKLSLIINKLHKQMHTNYNKRTSILTFLSQYYVYKLLILNVQYRWIVTFSSNYSAIRCIIYYWLSISYINRYIQILIKNVISSLFPQCYVYKFLIFNAYYRWIVTIASNYSAIIDI